MDISELRVKANQLRKNRSYSQAISFYEELWTTHRKSCDDWDGWGYAFCLNKLKKYEESLEICREVYRINSGFNYLKNLYAWNIFHIEIKKNEIKDEKRFIKAANGILKLSDQSDNFSPFIPTVFKVLDYFNHKPIFNADEILYWTDKLNSSLLDDYPVSILDNTGKTRELSSKKEKCFALRSKALYELKKYTACIVLSEEALQEISKFHHSNDIWFKRNIALSNFHLKNYDIALEQLKDILLLKKEWFIQKEIADIYYNLEKYNLALQYAVDAALNFGDFEKKLNLFLLMAYTLQKLKDQDNAKSHIELVASIRLLNNWKINSELQSLMDFYKIESNVSKENYTKIKNNLKHYWDIKRSNNRPREKGKIIKILPNGKSGFIQSEAGISYYFNTRDFNADFHFIRIDQAVSFTVDDGFDKKKNKRTKIAVEIKNE